MMTECKPVSTWWTKKNYDKWYNVLKKEGVAGLRRLDCCPAVPEIDRWMSFKDVVIDYCHGVGFVFEDRDCTVETKPYFIVWSRTFFYDCCLDETRLEKTPSPYPFPSEVLLRQPGLEFVKNWGGVEDVSKWIKDKLELVGEKDEEC